MHAVAATLLAANLFAAPAAWPALGPPATPAAAPATSDAALVVAIESYADVPKVPGALQNGEDWYAHLTRARGIPLAQVTLLRDRDATLEKLRRHAAEAAARVKPGGTLWIVFIGHGAPAKGGDDGLLVGWDAQQDPDSLYARSLPKRELLALAGKGAQARTVLVIDACFSGRTEGGAPLVPGLQPLIPVAARAATAGVIELTAGGADQFAGPLPGVARPAFSYLVLGALRGWGDADRDGVVTSGEALDYTKDALGALLRDRSQTPQLAGERGVALAKEAKERGPELSALALLRAAPASVAAGPAPAGERVGLTAFVLCRRKLPDGRFEDLPNCTEATLAPGDRLKFALEVDRAAHLYVLNSNSRGQFQTLFPDPGVDNELAPGARVLLPPGEDWLEIDDVGPVTEQLRVIASIDKLPALEVLRGLDVPARADGKRPEAEAKADAALSRFTARGFNKPASATTVKVGADPVTTLPLLASSPGVVVIEFSVKHR